MNKILVLENIGSIEDILANYLSTYYKNDEIKILNNLKSRKPEEIIEGLKWCDILMVQSIFDRTDQIESFIALIDRLKINPEVHLLHSTDRLLEFLNITITKGAREKLQELLVNGLKVFHVHHQTFELKGKPGDYFKKLTFKFCPILLWYNKKDNLIFDEHQFLIDKYEGFYYKKKTYFLENEPNEIFNLNKSELAELKKILSEVAAELDDREEDLDCGVTEKYCSKREVDEISKEIRERKSLLSKLKIASYK
ncbi:MAG: hypothetical protein ABIP51_01735 [Bacteroidia bacterium]